MTSPGVELLQIMHRHGLRIFTTGDILTLTRMNPSAATHALVRLSANHLLERLKRGVWLNRMATGLDPFEVLSHLTAPWPAYVSLQSALSRLGLIEETPSVVFAVSSGPPRTWRTPLAAYHIHHLPEALIWGYRVEQAGPAQYLLAEPEKAFLDLAYLGLVPRSPIGFPYKRDCRWRLDRLKLRRYAQRFHYPPLIAFLKKNRLYRS